MTVSYTINTSDHWGLTQYVYLHNWRQGGPLAFATSAVPVWHTLSLVRDGTPLLSALRSGLMIFIATLLVTYPLLRFIVWRKLRVLPRHILRIEMTLAKDGIHVKTPKVSQTSSWKAVLKVCRDRRAIYLFISPRMAHIIPLRAFASKDDADACEDFANRMQASAR